MLISSSTTSNSFLRRMPAVGHRSLLSEADVELGAHLVDEFYSLQDTIDEANSDARSLSDEGWSE